MRQACADGNVDEALKIHREFLNNYQEGETILWISYHLLGQREKASLVIRPYDAANQMYALSSYLSYPYFDPTPHPRLMAILNQQGIERPPPTTIPFQCNVPADKT